MCCVCLHKLECDMCICGYVHVCIFLCTSVLMRRKVTSWWQLASSVFSTLIFETGDHTKPWAHWFGSSPPTASNLVMSSLYSSSHEGWQSKFRFLCYHRKIFTIWAISSVPNIKFKMDFHMLDLLNRITLAYQIMQFQKTLEMVLVGVHQETALLILVSWLSNGYY